MNNDTVTSPAPTPASPRDAATVVVLRDGARGTMAAAHTSPPGDPRHAIPDVLGGTMFRIQLVEGRYRPVGAA